VDAGAGLDTVVKRKFPAPAGNRNSDQPVAQRYTTELSWLSTKSSVI